MRTRQIIFYLTLYILAKLIGMRERDQALLLNLAVNGMNSDLKDASNDLFLEQCGPVLLSYYRNFKLPGM